MDYKWYFDGIAVSSGTITMNPIQNRAAGDPEYENTVTYGCIWDGNRHEIMFVAYPDNKILEISKQNNILYDFTDALIVGLTTETGLVESFRTGYTNPTTGITMPPQRNFGIGSISFEDYMQRTVKLWNIRLARNAGNLYDTSLAQIKDRVRILFKYHKNGELNQGNYHGNYPGSWPEVDMLLGVY